MAAAGLMEDFTLPADLEAAEPPEARGFRRDDVRLLVSDLDHDSIEHARFRDLPQWLSAGDLLVVNTSGTMNAALPAMNESGEAFELHLSTGLPGGFWTVEVRRPGAGASVPSVGVYAGVTFRLPAEGSATLLAPYPLIDSVTAASRLWIAALHLPVRMLEYLDQHGTPIRYSYVTRPWPSSMYQTVFATEPGSAEMPSAGRPFTAELIARLVSRGVQIAPLLLHTGVASLEHHEPPYEEYYRVPGDTAERVNATRHSGRHIVAVGTTVVRALETVTDERGMTYPGEGWTNLVITPERAVRSVSGLITGFHEPHASHLVMLDQVATASARQRPSDPPIQTKVCGPCHLQRAYREARQLGYLWHEFGDSHLILGRRMRPRSG